jgi:hypothetical protein
MELQTVSDVREFFRDALQSALEHQHLQVRDHTEHYIVNLLAMFSHTEALFEPDAERAQLKPLALLLAEAADAPDDRQRFRMLQRLGDVALFVGLLAGTAPPGGRRYHIAMGCCAYGALAQAPYYGAQRVLGQVFAELEDKFQPIVDALNEIGESAARNSPRDVLRLYELWHKTGSQRAHRLLLKLGIRPVPAGTTAN